MSSGVPRIQMAGQAARLPRMIPTSVVPVNEVSGRPTAAARPRLWAAHCDSDSHGQPRRSSYNLNHLLASALQCASGPRAGVAGGPICLQPLHTG